MTNLIKSMWKKIKEIIDTPAEKFLVAFVILVIIIGGGIWFGRSESIKNFLADKQDGAATTSANSGGESMRIPILGQANTSDVVINNNPATSTQTSAPSGQIASGIQTETPSTGGQTQSQVSNSNQQQNNQAASIATETKPSIAIAVEVQDNFTGRSLDAIEQQIRLSPDVVSISRTRIHGKDALGYTTRGSLSHNVAYLDGSKIYYLASQNFIPES